jgi:hypothetical protein
MVTNELQSHGIDVLPPLPPPQAGVPWAWLALPLLLVLLLAAALARRRRWSGALRALQRSLRAGGIPPRQAGHRLAGLLRQIPAARLDAIGAVRHDLDALRFAREEPLAERLIDLIARTRESARRTTDGR